MTDGDDQGDKDPRYTFQFVEREILVAMGRISFGASYLESVVATMLWRVLDNDDLDSGRRLTADASFRWLVDHARALSEYRLSSALHERMVAWLARAEVAYRARSRIVHAHWAISSAPGKRTALALQSSTARGKSFVQREQIGDADELHAIAVELEAAGLAGVMLMADVQQEVCPPEPRGLGIGGPLNQPL